MMAAALKRKEAQQKAALAPLSIRPPTSETEGDKTETSMHSEPRSPALPKGANKPSPRTQRTSTPPPQDATSPAMVSPTNRSSSGANQKRHMPEENDSTANWTKTHIASHEREVEDMLIPLNTAEDGLFGKGHHYLSSQSFNAPSLSEYSTKQRQRLMRSLNRSLSADQCLLLKNIAATPTIAALLEASTGW